MNKFLKIGILPITALFALSACKIPFLPGGGGNSGKTETSDSGSSQLPPSSNPSSEIAPKTGLDLVIEQFVDGVGLEVPSLNEYGMQHEVYYSYYYQNYVVSAYVATAQNLDVQYNRKFASSGWTSWNDDDYPVEEVGYIWVDDAEDPLIEIYFSVQDGFFDVTIYRDDGKAGQLNVSDVDTNWYVDYVREYGFEHGSSFPADDIKDFLNVEANPIDPVADHYAYSGVDAGLDEDGYPVPATYYVLTEKDDADEYVKKLSAAGYSIKMETVQTIDWSTFEIVEYESYEAIDADHELVVKFQSDSNPFMISFNAFEDVYSDKLTENTDWTAEEAKIMTDYLGETLPFIALGDGYEVGNIESSDEDDAYIYIYDNYYLDLSEEIGQALEAAGFEANEDMVYDAVYYEKDNRAQLIQVYVSYYGGNYITAYYYESQYVEATAVELNFDQIECIAGYEFDLVAALEPENASSKVTFESDNENVTVDDKGHVAISNSAPVDTVATITATAEEGVTATCEITVKENVVTGILLDKTEADVAIGKTLQLTASTLPLGTEADITWSSSDEAVGTVDAEGLVTIKDTANVNDIVTIKAELHDDNTIFEECEITVINQPSFEKVTSGADLTDGLYLIVSEEDGVALNGGAPATIDAANNTVDVTINDNKIECTDELEAAAFTLTEGKEGHTIVSKDGYYLTASDKKVVLTEEETEMDVSIGTDGNAIISSGSKQLLYNAADSGLRFRFYATTSKDVHNIQLYKMAA